MNDGAPSADLRQRRASQGTVSLDSAETMALEMRGIDKRFGRVLALDGAGLSVARGSVHALLGENGAGKTTLMRIAFGMLRADGGTVVVDGVARRLESPAEAIAAGLGMVHQHFALVGAMTVAENVALVTREWRYRAGEAAERVRALGEATGLTVDPGARAGELSVEAQQRVEILKALARDARTLILDEPTAVLAPGAAAELLRWVRRFADGGRSVVLITHKLRDALLVADDVTVLRRGRTVASMGAAAASESSLATAMLGAASESALGGGGESALGAREDHALVGVSPMQGAPLGAVVVRADHVDVVDGRGVTKIHGATFDVRGGEIVGVAAVEGEGQIELLRVLAGRAPATAGTVTAPRDVGFVPEDRQRDALIGEFALYENVVLRGAGQRRGRVRWAEARRATDELMHRYDVRAEGRSAAVSSLSGGNQQKFVMAREIEGSTMAAANERDPAAATGERQMTAVRHGRDMQALVVANPTRGLDIQASAAVRERLRDARWRGAAVIVYSSDLDEVLDLADRVLVVAHGAVRELPAPFDRDTVGRAMLGLDPR